MIDLGDKTVLITGAARGIGSGIARACASAGAKVILHYSASQTSAQALANELGSACAGTVQSDLTKPKAAAKLWADAEAHSPRIDALINNAAIFVNAPLDSADDEWLNAWERTLAVDLTSPALLCKAAIAHFKANGGGKIINVASRAGHRGDDPEMAAYAAAKGGLLALTKTIARGLAQDGIVAYAIAPGWVDTDMAPQDEANRAKALRDVPLGRMATPEEIGALTAFLVSDLCRSATGATFDVNGASYVR